jgi:hypothetical protein
MGVFGTGSLVRPALRAASIRTKVRFVIHRHRECDRRCGSDDVWGVACVADSFIPL